MLQNNILDFKRRKQSGEEGQIIRRQMNWDIGSCHMLNEEPTIQQIISDLKHKKAIPCHPVN